MSQPLIQREPSLTVLVAGGTGFIGRHLVAALGEAGYRVVALARHPPARDPARPWLRFAAVNYTSARDPSAWLPLLTGIDIVINAVGIFRQHGAQTFDALHRDAPSALFSACSTTGIKLVVQISALGADAGASSAYHLSKRQADDFLAAQRIPWVIVQPSIVYGSHGTSARLFNALATLPVVPVPGSGDQLLQPIAIDDVVDAVVALLHAGTHRGERIALVGPEPMPLRTYLARLRSALGMGPALFAPVPMTLARAGACVASLWPRSVLNTAALDMLLRGSTADPASIENLLGRAPRPVELFIAPGDAKRARVAAKLSWLLPLLRFSVAALWMWSGVVSLGLYPVQASYELLDRTGIRGAAATVSLYGAAMLDLALGIACLTMQRRRALWLVQLAVIGGYTLIISFAMPDLWLHPFGPVAKNVPLAAAILLLYALEADA